MERDINCSIISFSDWAFLYFVDTGFVYEKIVECRHQPNDAFLPNTHGNSLSLQTKISLIGILKLEF